MANAETGLKARVIEAINVSRLAYVWSNPAGTVRARNGYVHMAPEGTPDIIGFARDGRFVGIETKILGNSTKKSRLEKQRLFRDRLLACGAIGGFARSPAEALAILRWALRMPGARAPEPALESPAAKSRRAARVRGAPAGRLASRLGGTSRRAVP